MILGESRFTSWQNYKLVVLRASRFNSLPNKKPVEITRAWAYELVILSSKHFNQYVSLNRAFGDQSVKILESFAD